MQRMRRLQRIVSRREKGSVNRKKAVGQLARAHLRVANIRKNALHKATSLLAKTKSAVVLEDLNVRGMMKNHYLAQAISDVGLYEFSRQLEYKGEWYGCRVLFADPYYPSTKRCSRCAIDLSDPLQVKAYYQQVLTHGRGEDVAELDQGTIRRLLPEMNLPSAVRRLWEDWFDAHR